MATSVDKKRGCNTPEYTAVRSNYLRLALSIEQLLPRLTAECFGKNLISVAERNSISKEKSSPEGSTLLLNSILSKIELDYKWYGQFISILGGYPELKKIRCEVDEALNKCTSIDSGLNMPPDEKGRLLDSANSSTKGSTLTLLNSSIEQLKTAHDLKHKIVQDLERNIEEKEDAIKDLKIQCEEAGKRATEKEQLIESIQEKHKDKIRELQQKIDALKLELEKARTKLVKAELNKEIELNKLKILQLEEKAEYEIKLRIKSEEGERIAREAAERAQEELSKTEERERTANARLFREGNRQNNHCVIL